MDKFNIPHSGLPPMMNSGLQPNESIQTPTMAGSNPVFNSKSDVVTPEFLDSYINNPNMNPILRQQALETKLRLFPEPPKQNENVIEKPTQIKEIPTISNPAVVESKGSDLKIEKMMKLENNDFSSLLNTVSNKLFSQKINLLSDENINLDIRSMTVAEYKFMTKQVEIYDSLISSLSKKDENYSRNLRKRESVLLSCIDVVLQKCITNNISVMDLLFYDWIYLAIVLRMISRGDSKIFKTTCDNQNCKSDISINVEKILSNLTEKKNNFLKTPIDLISFNDITLYIAPPSRKDIFEVEKTFITDYDSNFDILNLASYIRAIVKNDIAYVLTYEQKVQLMNVLNTDILNKIKISVDENINSFYTSMGTFTCSECQKEVHVDFSDFILFFFAF